MGPAKGQAQWTQVRKSHIKTQALRENRESDCAELDAYRAGAGDELARRVDAG